MATPPKRARVATATRPSAEDDNSADDITPTRKRVKSAGECHNDDLDLGFGQYEPLTRRLNNILRDYNDGLAVLKELLQNADDAGGTEIHFLYDERQNNDAKLSLLDKGMKELQGPALWTYNDAIFTESDFQNIVKLSGATKEYDTDKIGRFGVGFNVVYNLTDVPMFISDSSIVIFDPHTTFLGPFIQDRRKPGIRLNLRTHRAKIQKFSDQFKPFNGIFRCDLSVNSRMTSFRGTLFRFPLRTSDQATRSEICKISYQKSDVMTLIKLLNETGHQMLLYTQNVKKISVSHLPENSTTASEAELWFSIEKHEVKILRNVGVDPKLSVLKQSSKHMEEYRVSPQLDIHRAIPALEISTLLKLTTRYGSVIPKELPKRDLITYWLVVSCLGKSESFKISLANPKLIAVGGVAARLVNDGDTFKVTAIANGGLIFCFMPLPIKTVLPLHINGYFEIYSSRTHLYERSFGDTDCERAKWNEALLDDVVTRAYIVLLEDLTRLSPACDAYALWPTARSLKEAGIVSRLIESVYKAICRSPTIFQPTTPSVIKDDTRWVPFADCKILDEELTSDAIAVVVLQVFKVVSNNTTHVVELPGSIRKIIKLTSSAAELQKRTVHKIEFFKTWFLPNVQQVKAEQRDKLILYALFDKTLSKVLMNVTCIPVSHKNIAGQSQNSFRAIADLVHPNSQISVLFDADEGRFPKISVQGGRYLSKDIFDALITLGMKHDDLSWQEIIERCRLVEKNRETMRQRTSVILDLIEKKLETKAKMDRFTMQAIQIIKFLPVMPKPNKFPLKWRGDKFAPDRLISFEEAYLKSKKFIVCCSHPVLDEKHAFGTKGGHQLKNALRLSEKPISVETVITQIIEVVLLDKGFGTISHLDIESLKVVQRLTSQAFANLNVLIEMNSEYAEPCSIFQSKKCILFEKGLLLMPYQCATSFPFATEVLLPYLAEIPNSMKSHGELLMAIGVKDVFNLDDYIRALNDIQASANGTKLNKKQLDAAIAIIATCLYSEVNLGRLESGTLVQQYPNTPMPSADSRMCPASQLCFNNCLWLMKEKRNFCHELIPQEIASSLGVRTIREDMFHNKRITTHPFGQKEKLAKRIRRILDGYLMNEDILKEMLQNADDSGATEVHFIIDTRNLPTKKVFCDNWKLLQGPALCVYNNKPFTIQDLDGIQNLGGGSKADDATKTGQFGVGFNAVYNLTDVPTLLTTVDGMGSVLCVFDPNCRYVPEASLVEPGAMYMVDDLKDKFPDVFEGYLQNEKKYNISKSGTIFRLPLRTSDMAAHSEISKKQVTVDQIGNLFREFKGDMYESLIFTNNIEKICLKEVRDGAGKGIVVDEIYSVHIEMSDEARQTRSSFQKYIGKMALKLRLDESRRQKISLADIAFLQVNYELSTNDSTKTDVWKVVQRFGFEDPSKLSTDILAASKNGEIGLLPRGGVACLKEPAYEKKEFCGRLFCFLPLPVSVNFPVHINGHFALDNETRRKIWSDKQEKVKNSWNQYLMEEVVAPAYCQLICNMRDEIKNSRKPYTGGAKRQISHYLKLFPIVSASPRAHTAPDHIVEMTQSIYKLIAAKQLPVLPLLQILNDVDAEIIKWLGPMGERNAPAYFDDLKNQIQEPPAEFNSFRTSESIAQAATIKGSHLRKFEIARQLLIRCGFNLFGVDLQMFHNFTSAGAEVQCVSPSAVLQFLATYGDRKTRCKVINLPMDLAKTPYQNLESLSILLEYCATEPKYKECLEGLPLLLTCDGKVRTFNSNDPKYACRFLNIASKVPHKFMHQKISELLHLNQSTDMPLCKKFTIQELSQILPLILPKDEFFGSEKCVSLRTLEKKVTKSETWLHEIWSFLSTFMPVKNISRNCTKDETAAKILFPILDWSLLPVRCCDGEKLFPLSKASCVLADNGFALETECFNILKNMGVSQPILSRITGEHSGIQMQTLVSDLLGSVNKPISVVNALQDLMERAPSKLRRQLANGLDDGLKLLGYFSRSIEQSESLLSGATHALKRLPFYVTIYGKVIDLQGNLKAYVLPDAVPHDDMERWSKKQSVIFLKHISEISSLLKYLGCERLSISDVYISHVFSNFSILSPAAQERHMRFVRDYIAILRLPCYDLDKATKQNAELVNLLAGLQTLEFIPIEGTGQLARASALHDPTNAVFLAMESSDKFPSQLYQSSLQEDWLGFLKDCGLIYNVTMNKFLAYIRTVEREARGKCTEDVCKKSSVLLDHLWSRDDLNFDFIQRIREVKFIAPYICESALEKLHPQYGDRDTRGRLNFIAFVGSVPSRQANLIWTVQNIVPLPPNLPFSTSEKPGVRKEILSHLGVVTEVTVAQVAAHAETLCKYLFRSRKLLQEAVLVDKLSKVLKKVYSFLSGKLPLEDEAIDVLRGTPFVFVRDFVQLVRPNQISIEISKEQEIKPHLYRIPAETTEFAKLFEALGATLKISSTQYAAALREIHDISSGQEGLNPDEWRCVEIALCGWFAEQQRLIKSNDGVFNEELYLPCTDNHLHISCDVMFMDDSLLGLRAGKPFDQPLLIELRQLKVDRIDARVIFKGLPKSRQPAFFSDLVQEIFDSSSPEIACPLAIKMTARIKSTEFEEGFERLLRHGISMSESSIRLPDHVDLLVQECIESVRCIQFVGRLNIGTQLKFQSSILPHSHRNKDYFCESVTENDQTYSIIHIKHTFEADCEFYFQMATILLSYARVNVSNIESRLLLLLQCSIENIAGTLDSLEIRQLNHDSEQSRAFNPSLGTRIPIDTHAQLVQDCFKFWPGQLVALETDDPLDREEDGEPTYILVEIMERLENDRGKSSKTKCCVDNLYRVKINHDNEVKIVDATMLYSFSRLKENKELACSLVLYTGQTSNQTGGGANANAQDESKDDTDEPCKDFSATIREIKNILKEAWALTEASAKRRAIRRLRLRYHPDKYPSEQKPFFTKVFQKLQNLIEQLQEGLSIDDSSNEDESCTARTARGGAGGGFSGFSRGGGFGGFGSKYDDHMRSRARRHRKRRRRNEKRNFNAGSWSNTEPGSSGGAGSAGQASSGRDEQNRYFFDFKSRPNPQPGEASRWLKQAKHDINAAINDGETAIGESAYEWMAFKCFQAAKKALRAAQLFKDSNQTFKQEQITLRSFCDHLEDVTLSTLAHEVDALLVSSDHTQYPYLHNMPSTPRSAFSVQTALEAMGLCEKIVQHCTDYIAEHLD